MGDSKEHGARQCRIAAARGGAEVKVEYVLSSSVSFLSVSHPSSPFYPPTFLAFSRELVRDAGAVFVYRSRRRVGRAAEGIGDKILSGIRDKEKELTQKKERDGDAKKG